MILRFLLGVIIFGLLQPTARLSAGENFVTRFKDKRLEKKLSKNQEKIDAAKKVHQEKMEDVTDRHDRLEWDKKELEKHKAQKDSVPSVAQFKKDFKARGDRLEQNVKNSTRGAERAVIEVKESEEEVKRLEEKSEKYRSRLSGGKK